MKWIKKERKKENYTSRWRLIKKNAKEKVLEREKGIEKTTWEEPSQNCFWLKTQNENLPRVEWLEIKQDLLGTISRNKID